MNILIDILADIFTAFLVIFDCGIRALNDFLNK